MEAGARSEQSALNDLSSSDARLFAGASEDETETGRAITMKDAPTLGSHPWQRLMQSLRNACAGWDRFWFQPANPTTLGLIRICAGLLIFYIHLAYTPNLF